MSAPTPRTDAATALTSQHRYDDSFGDPEFGWVTAGFARTLERELAAEREKVRTLREACERLRDCDWVITLPDRMDAVRDIARAALDATEDKP